MPNKQHTALGSPTISLAAWKIDSFESKSCPFLVPRKICQPLKKILCYKLNNEPLHQAPKGSRLAEGHFSVVDPTGVGSSPVGGNLVFLAIFADF